MKVLKELPFSLWHSWRLARLSILRLQNQEKPEVPIIITLTSIESRLNTLHLVIRSLMDQSVRPHRILIWLHEDLSGKVPDSVKKLLCDWVELKYSTLTEPHKKLTGSMRLFPQAVLLTCDDDMMYDKRWLQVFWEEHQQRPDAILAVRTVYIQHDETNQPLPFTAWRNTPPGKLNPKAHLPIGLWGTLYPPGSLHEDFDQEDLFRSLAPFADDLWFKAMSLRQGTLSLPTFTRPGEPIPIRGTQKIALKNTNVKQGGNTRQWKALSDHFDLPKLLLQNTAL